MELYSRRSVKLVTYVQLPNTGIISIPLREDKIPGAKVIAAPVFDLLCQANPLRTLNARKISSSIGYFHEPWIKQVCWLSAQRSGRRSGVPAEAWSISALRHKPGKRAKATRPETERKQ
jgi:hypothetical protein